MWPENRVNEPQTLWGKSFRDDPLTFFPECLLADLRPFALSQLLFENPELQMHTPQIWKPPIRHLPAQECSTPYTAKERRIHRSASVARNCPVRTHTRNETDAGRGEGGG